MSLKIYVRSVNRFGNHRQTENIGNIDLTVTFLAAIIHNLCFASTLMSAQVQWGLSSGRDWLILVELFGVLEAAILEVDPDIIQVIVDILANFRREQGTLINYLTVLVPF